jgi:hypothetical protein
MIWVIVAAVVLGTVAALFGWDRYRGGSKNSGGTAARPTDEVFVDPETGRRMRVWYDEHSGQREYRPDGNPGQGPAGR